MDFAAFDGPYRTEGGEAHTAEKDMEKLGEFYYLGYSDGQNHLDSLREYLES